MCIITDTKVFSKTYQKRFCVISEGIFYYFDSPTAKKQSGAFYLSGKYHLTLAVSVFIHVSYEV